MINHDDRLARRAKYEELDPYDHFQDIGYDYLTDVTGLRLKKLPRNREYVPLEQQTS